MTSPLKTTLLLLIFVLMSGCNTSPEVEEKNGEEASRIQETLSTDEQTNTLVPKDWKLVQSATGDLNWDNRDDHALIVEQNIGTDLLEGAYAFPNRKILVFFADTKNGDFELIAENDSLIPIQTENMEEPLQNIQITDGLLEIGLEMFYGSGTWETQRTSYTFVYKNEALLLAEANGQLIFRNTLDFEKYRFDFEHQKWTKEKGNRGIY